MKHRAAPDKTGIQLVRQSIAAEFDIKIPQHFGLGEGKRAISGLRKGPEEILRQSEQRLEGARRATAVTVVHHDHGLGLSYGGLRSMCSGQSA